MLIRSLILPGPSDEHGNVHILDNATGQIIVRQPVNTDITWDHLAGNDQSATGVGAQPYTGCQTGGDKVMARLMEHLSNDCV